MDPRRALPVPPEADCAPPSASCWLSGHDEPAGACGAALVPVFSILPSHLPLRGEAAPTSWWSWVAAGCLGP